MKFLQGIWQRLKKKEKERIIVLDASALETNKAMQIIEKASKIILLTGTIRELDNYKKASSQYGQNIRTISRKSREDENSQKYVCVAGYEKNSYQDDNIIDYCRKNRNTIILTNDNNLCNMAKAFKIPYIFSEDEDIKDKEIKEEQIVEEVVNEKGQNIKGVIFKNGQLYLSEEVNGRISFVLRDEEIIQNDSNSYIRLQVEDCIYQLKYKDESVIILEYKIRQIKNSNYAEHSISIKVEPYEVEKIRDKRLSKEVQEQILLLLQKNKEMPKIKEKEKVIQEEESKQEEKQKEVIPQEIYFYQNYIRVSTTKNYRTYIKVERERKLIEIKDYQEGDILYLLKYNIKSKYLRVEMYKIATNNNTYRAEKIDEYKIWYINEIYTIKFSEELQEEIWKLYIQYCGY